jgi:hypothetical protein
VSTYESREEFTHILIRVHAMMRQNSIQEIYSNIVRKVVPCRGDYNDMVYSAPQSG